MNDLFNEICKRCKSKKNVEMNVFVVVDMYLETGGKSTKEFHLKSPKTYQNSIFVLTTEFRTLYF